MSRHPERIVRPLPVSGPKRRAARPARVVMLSIGMATALVLSACTSAEPDVDPQPGSPTATATPPTPSAEAPAEPTLIADGTAQENLPLFTAVTADVWAGPEQASGRAYVDALVAAGFDKRAMQVTSDQTTVGNPAETIQFSVQWSRECLIGQVGPATGTPVTVVVPELAEGTCLLGRTRPIDW